MYSSTPSVSTAIPTLNTVMYCSTKSVGTTIPNPNKATYSVLPSVSTVLPTPNTATYSGTPLSRSWHHQNCFFFFLFRERCTNRGRITRKVCSLDTWMTVFNRMLSNQTLYGGVPLCLRPRALTVCLGNVTDRNVSQHSQLRSKIWLQNWSRLYFHSAEKRRPICWFHVCTETQSTNAQIAGKRQWV